MMKKVNKRGPTFNVEEAIRLYQQDNLSIQQVSDIMGVNRNAVYTQFKKHNVNTKKPSKKELIIKLCEEGTSIEDIIQQTGAAKDYIQQLRRTTNIYRQEQQSLIDRDNLIIDESKRLSFNEVITKYDGEIGREIITRIYDQNNLDRQRSTSNVVKTANHFDDIIEMLRKGRSFNNIAETFNITNTDYIKEVMLEHYPEYDKIPQGTPEKIHRLLQDRDWCSSAAERHTVGGVYGITRELNELGVGTVGPDMVRQRLQHHGISNVRLTATDMISELNDEVWLRENYEYYSLSEIGEMIGCSQPTVREAFDRYNIPVTREYHTSKLERQVVEYIKSIYDGEIIRNDRTLIRPKELDIIIPDLKIAIEVCGIYWHSEKFKPNSYHLDKLNETNEAGYRLVTIFEDEWTHKQNITKLKIANILGVATTDIIYARKCKVVELDNVITNEFLNVNHIQGSANDSIRYGLIHEDVLVAVMTFRKDKHSDGMDLNRFATSCRVIGGFSKLLKYAEKNNDWTQISTFADMRWSCRESNIYESNGFAKIHETKPAYMYMNRITKTREHRMNFTRQKMKQKYSEFNEELTERQNANNLGFLAVYDCGNIKYVKRLTKDGH